MNSGPLPGKWPRTIYVCPACGRTLGDAQMRWIPTCNSLSHETAQGVPVEVTPLHEAEYRPASDPREREDWEQMTDEERQHAMAEYLAKQAGADV